MGPARPAVPIVPPAAELVTSSGERVRASGELREVLKQMAEEARAEG